MKEINIKTATVETLMQTLDDNKREYMFKQKEIKRLKKIAIPEKKSIILPRKENSNTTPRRKPKINKLEEEMMSHIQKFQSANPSELKDILPSKANGNYQNIIFRLRLESIKTISEINEIITQYEEELTLEELKYYKKELRKEQDKQNILITVLEPEQQTKLPEEKIENDFIFAPTQGGNIRVLEELEKNIPREYYESFLGLIESMKKGVFKNMRKVHGPSINTRGFYEVRDIIGGTRLFVDKIDDNKIVLISAFVKKTDSNNNYYNTVQMKIREYNNRKQALINNLSNPEFIVLNKQYEMELFNKLSNNKDKVVKEK